MKVLNWNIEWAERHLAKGRRITSKIEEIDPDLVCYTEATTRIIPADGFAIASGPDYGYPNDGSRRKVILWSRRPWDEVDYVGSKDLPGGRFITGITAGIRFVGICIPWRNAHVTSGRRDRTLWQDHHQYLDALKPLADAYFQSKIPVCFLGDFNQRLPRKWQPVEAKQRLDRTFSAGYRFATAGVKDSEGHLLIDHIAVGSGLTAHVVELIPKSLEPGQPLSDHVGVVAQLDRT